MTGRSPSGWYRKFVGVAGVLLLLWGVLVGWAPLAQAQEDTSAGTDGSRVEQPSATLEQAVEKATLDLLGKELVTLPIITPLRTLEDWTFGIVAVPAAEEHDSPLAWLFLAQQSAGAWEVALEPTQAFQDGLLQAPETLLSHEELSVLTQPMPDSLGNGAALLSLPWATGETWTLTGGPHNNPRPWDAIDFANGSSGRVRAARDGIAYVPCSNYVVVKHGSSWSTTYYHLTNIAVGNGASVARGTLLGRTSASAGCGGSATGPHVHFGIERSGQAQNINGHDIGGWTVQEGSTPYAGCMLKNGNRQCASSGRIYNNGQIGNGGNYHYLTNTSGAMCGNIVRLKLHRYNRLSHFNAEISKCDGSRFSQNGRVKIVVNGRVVAERTYSAGDYSVWLYDINPYGQFRISGRNSYMAQVYSADQPTIPKNTGTVDAWEEFYSTLAP